MRILLLTLSAALAVTISTAPEAFAQGKGRDGFGPQRDGFSPPGRGMEDRGRDRDFQRGDARERRESRPERMRPEDREKLRRDIEEANKQMGGKRR